jgi:hypothetical protein
MLKTSARQSRALLPIAYCAEHVADCRALSSVKTFERAQAAIGAAFG